MGAIDSDELALCRELCNTKITQVEGHISDIIAAQKVMRDNQSIMIDDLNIIKTKIEVFSATCVTEAKLKPLSNKVDIHETYFQLIGAVLIGFGAKIIGLLGK